MDTGETIDLTPTWQGLVGGLIAVLQNDDAPVESHNVARDELFHMARLADSFVEATRNAQALANEEVA